MQKIGVALFAKNEAQNLGRMVRELLEAGESLAFLELVVDGARDGSDELAEKLKEEFPELRIKVSSTAKGKWPAIQSFCEENQNFLNDNGVLLMSADLWVQKSIVQIIAGEATAKKGPMAMGARVIPVNPIKGFGRVVHVLWAIHHAAALLKPRAGEALFFKGKFPNLPNDLVVDEPAIYQFVRKNGGEVKYLKEVALFNLGPNSMREYLNRRRSITGGYLQLKNAGLGERYKFKENLTILSHIFRWLLLGSPVGRGPVLVACLLEMVSRGMGIMDLKQGKLSQNWEVAPSTKSYDVEILTQEKALEVQKAFF